MPEAHHPLNYCIVSEQEHFGAIAGVIIYKHGQLATIETFISIFLEHLHALRSSHS